MNLSHGHPPSVSSRSDRHSQQAFHARTEITTPSLVSSPHYDPPFSLQNRRLHLRNVGFRGTKVSSQRLGVKISRFFTGPEIPQSELAPPRNQENTSPENQSTHSPRSHQPQSATLGILQEISNSTRSRYSQKRPNIPIAEDNPERPLLDRSPAAESPGSWYHDASSTQQSPVTFHTTDAEFDKMKLREISGNERRSPTCLSSPLAKRVRSRQKRGIDLRKTAFEASEYIEHIENELQQVKEAMHSPNTGKPMHEKLKILQAENEQLKETISELEETFDERVKQAVEHNAAIEVDMRKKIKALEDDLASKENKISDLEHGRDEPKYDSGGVETLRAMIDRLEQEKQCLEEANRVVEKRNEALVGLLAQSPTRSHHGFELASPIRQGPRRTPRPKSMMISKVQSSPRSENYQRPRSVQISPAPLSTGHFSPNTALKLTYHHPCNDVAEIYPLKTSDSESLDSGLGESCSAHSPEREYSGRSSIASNVSASPSAWGLPLTTPSSNDQATVKQNKHRRTRRFESGSTQLKPLLLPTIASEGNVYQMSYTPTLSSSPTPREFSRQPLDPTISLLAQTLETSVQRTVLPSKWDSETALRALEGSPEPQFETFEDIIARYNSNLAGFASSPISPQTYHHVHNGTVQETDSPTYMDDTIIEDDINALANYPESRATDEESHSSLNGEVTFTAPDQDRTWSNQQEVTSSYGQSSYAASLKFQRSSENRPDTDYTPLRQHSAESSQKLMPEPLFLPSALNRTAVTSKVMSQRASLVLISGYEEDSPIPRKRQRSSDPNSCSFVMPTLCVNPAHEATVHKTPLSDTFVGTFHAPTDVSLKRRNIMSAPLGNPLEKLHKRTPSPIPLTSVTIRAIFGTLSRYTSYVREISRDPTALARRVIANAWHSNWKRLGKLSWWVLGLFLGPSPRTEKLDHVNSASRGCDRSDGEAIAEEVCDPAIRGTEREQNASSQEPLPRASNQGSLRFDEPDPGYRTAGTKTNAKPTLEQDHQNQMKKKSSWRRSLYLWGKFSVAILLAVGGAVVSGPEEMLRDCAEQTPRKTASPTQERIVKEQQNGDTLEEQTVPTNANEGPVTEISHPADANKAFITERKLSSEARLATSASAHSFSEAGAGPVIGIVKLGRSSLKTPSPAHRRRLASGSDLTPSKKYTFRSPRRHDGWDRFDDESCGRLAGSRACGYNPSRAKIPKAQHYHGKEDRGEFQWVQNLNITDLEVNDKEEGPRLDSESCKKTHSPMG